MSRLDYWRESVQSSLDVHGVTATEAQILAIASDMELSHESVGMAFHVPSGNPMQSEIDELRREMEAERSKTMCGECGGLGFIVTPGPYHSSESECFKCRGAGRCAPC